MQVIREQFDLASLPEPRFICTAPGWLRRFAACLLIFGAVIGGSVFVNGMVESGDPVFLIGGPVVVAICLSVLVLGRPLDWRVWVNIAATPDGLYLVARARRVVFVPWHDVIEIDVVRKATNRGIVNFARLTLRLSEERWTQFGNLSGIEGSGAVRRYLLPALTMPGDALAARLHAFRDGKV